jgi:mannan endo-1,4-beta-mannosidase
MKSRILSLAFAVFVAAAPLEPESKRAEQECTYPIGQHGNNFAKVAGRLFEIDGKVQYWAGTNAWWLAHLDKNSDIDISLSEMAQVSLISRGQIMH